MSDFGDVLEEINNIYSEAGEVLDFVNSYYERFKHLDGFEDTLVDAVHNFEFVNEMNIMIQSKIKTQRILKVIFLTITVVISIVKIFVL